MRSPVAHAGCILDTRTSMLMSSQVSIPLEKGIEAMGRQEFARGHSGEQVSEAAALGSYSFSCAPHGFLTQLSVRKQHSPAGADPISQQKSFPHFQEQ